MNLEIDSDALEFKIAPTKSHPMKVDYLSESREVLIRASLAKQESLSLAIDDDVIVVSFKKVDLRLSEEAVRKLFEALPPYSVLLCTLGLGAGCCRVVTARGVGTRLEALPS